MSEPPEIVRTTNQAAHWFRALRPLFLWGLLVGLALVYFAHRRLSEQTHLRFSASLNGQAVDWETSAFLDGLRVSPGDRVPIGWHTFSLSHPKAESFASKFFVWYGDHNLGKIALKRARGTLVIEANPPAPLLTIRGSEFERQLIKSSGTNFSVPTDHYFVKAEYPHWSKVQEALIPQGGSSTTRFAPPLGSLEVTSSHPETAFRLLGSDGQTIESGNLPCTLADLPEGSYKLLARHSSDEREQPLQVKRGETNTARVEFVYGAARFETKPVSASVTGADGREFGRTPVLLPELQPGLWKFAVRQEGYEPVLVELEIVANQTNAFSTNLVSTTYLLAVKAARDYLAAGDSGRALESALEALRVSPDDSAANALKRQASGLENVRLAKALAATYHYNEAIKKLESALESLPENKEARHLLDDYKKAESEAAAELRERWSRRGRELFNSVVRQHDGADLFQTLEYKSKKSIWDVQSDIVGALSKGEPAFKVLQPASDVPDAFVLDATYDIPFLATTSGRRECLIVITKIAEAETEVLAKVVEYQAEPKWPPGATLLTPPVITYVPAHQARITMSDSFKAKVQKGIANATARLEQALR